MLFFALLEDAGVEVQNGTRLDKLIHQIAAGDKDALAELYHETRAAI